MDRLCEICDQEVEERSWGGHRSGHVRKGQLLKRVRVTEHVCPICGKQFSSGMKLGGHKHIHRVEFDDVKSDGTRRERLKQERGHKCEVCGPTEWCDKPIPIELDHIDGDCTHNTKDNLRLICPNCHAQTDTYKGKNVGRVSGSERQKVMKRYIGLYRSRKSA